MSTPISKIPYGRYKINLSFEIKKPKLLLGFVYFLKGKDFDIYFQSFVLQTLNSGNHFPSVESIASKHCIQIG